MKTLFVLFFVLLPSILCGASEVNNDPPTKLDTFMAKKGSLHIRQFYKLGEISDNGEMDFDCIVLTEHGNRDFKLKGIKVEIKQDYLKQSNSSYLDMDEAEELSRVLGYMIDTSGKWKDKKLEAYTEVDFSTKGHFSIGFFKDDDNLKAYVSCGYLNKTTAYPEIDSLVEIKDLIDKGIAKLKGL